jgi:hypothetical protein
VGLVVVTAAVAYAGWRWGGPLFTRAEAWAGIEAEAGGDAVAGAPSASAELADETLDRVDRLRAGQGGERLLLDETELTSVVRYAAFGVLPPGVENPRVELRGDKAWFRARVALGAFPDLPAFEEVAGLLPDTVDLELRGTLMPFDDGHAVLHVERMEASRIPLPSRMIPAILRAFGRVHRDGLPGDALALPLPDGLASAYLEDDRLVLVADR